MHIQTVGKTILTNIIWEFRIFNNYPICLQQSLSALNGPFTIQPNSDGVQIFSGPQVTIEFGMKSIWISIPKYLSNLVYLQPAHSKHMITLFQIYKNNNATSRYCHGNSQQSFMSTNFFSNAHGQVHLVAIAVSLKAMTSHVWSPLICSWFCHGRYARFEGVAVRVALVKCLAFALQFERNRRHVVMWLCGMHCAGKIRPRIFMRNRFKPCEFWIWFYIIERSHYKCRIESNAVSYKDVARLLK